jgi:hypothetical protein
VVDSADGYSVYDAPCYPVDGVKRAFEIGVAIGDKLMGSQLNNNDADAMFGAKEWFAEANTLVFVTHCNLLVSTHHTVITNATAASSREKYFHHLPIGRNLCVTVIDCYLQNRIWLRLHVLMR